MPLRPFEEVSEPLAFPIGGKVYTPPPIGWETGTRLIRLMQGKEPELMDAEPGVLWRLLLGACFDEMCADGVPMSAIGRAGYAVLVAFQTDDRDAAVKIWEGGLDPEVRAAMLALARAGSRQSNSTDGENVTPLPASTSGTKSRPTRRQGKNRASAGATSSTEAL